MSEKHNLKEAVLRKWDLSSYVSPDMTQFRGKLAANYERYYEFDDVFEINRHAAEIAGGI